MKIDLHTHTCYSYDADRKPLCEHVKAAVKQGAAVLGFSEHVEFFRKESLSPTEFLPDEVDFEGYEREIKPFRSGRAIMPDLAAQQKDIDACRTKEIILRKGVEIGQPHAAPDLADALQQKYHFDYVIGSVHQLSNDMDFYFYRYETIHPDVFWDAYFNEIEAMLQYGRFQILGHINYPLRVIKLCSNCPSLKGYMDRVECILKRLVERGIALESNTKGLGLEQFVLQRYRELGGELVTVGSDSHAPETVARGIPQELERLKNIGFRYITDFKDGKPIQHIL